MATMEPWEKDLRDHATECAKEFNRLGFADPKMDKFLEDLKIQWDNESPEWCDQFVRVAKPGKIRFLIDSWTTENN